MSRPRSRRKRPCARPLPPPRLAAPGYERVGYWLLKSKAATGTATEYNDAVGALWAACTSTRTLPSPKQFARDLAAIRRKQAAAYARAADGATRADLNRVAAALSRVARAAADAGLLT